MVATCVTVVDDPSLVLVVVGDGFYRTEGPGDCEWLTMVVIHVMECYIYIPICSDVCK